MVRGYEVYDECRTHLTQSPLATLQNFYMDTFPGTPEAVMTAVRFSGADKILMGSDYPHQIGDLPGGVQTIQHTALNEADKALILGGNTVRLLKVTEG
jgi:aminocarboxymuconate-semialdehyde decarboxylase